MMTGINDINLLQCREVTRIVGGDEGTAKK